MDRRIQRSVANTRRQDEERKAVEACDSEQHSQSGWAADRNGQCVLNVLSRRVILFPSICQYLILTGKDAWYVTINLVPYRKYSVISLQRLNG